MNRFCSMFSQILQLFPRTDVQLLVKETTAERPVRGFSCWGQFVAMLFVSWVKKTFVYSRIGAAMVQAKPAIL